MGAGACLAGEGNAEGLGAEDGLACERQQRCVDSDRQLHGQLWGDDAGDDHGAVQEQLEAVTVGILQPACNHVRPSHAEGDTPMPTSATKKVQATVCQPSSTQKLIQLSFPVKPVK